MSKLARALALVAMLAAVQLAAMATVAQAHATDARSRRPGGRAWPHRNSRNRPGTPPSGGCWPGSTPSLAEHPPR
jgi:hypothetical protein